MNDVKAHISRTSHAGDGVQVSPVVVDQSPDLMNQSSDLLNLRLEDSQRVGIGQHQRGHVLVQERLEGAQVHLPSRVRGDLGNLVADQRRTRRIGPVG